MARGGPRAGAGRPVGVPNRPTQARQSMARESGKMPSTIMLENARILQGLAAQYQPRKLTQEELNDPSIVKPDEAKFSDYLMKSTECASKAAPYFEYRLAAMRITADPVDLSKLSDEQLRQLESIRRTATAERRDPSGIAKTLN